MLPRTGIEVTGLFIPNVDRKLPLQAEESLQERIVQSAKALYAAGSNPAVRVRIYFSAHEGISKQDVAEVAEFISRAVTEHIPANGNSCELEDEGEDHWPSCLNSVHISRATFITANDWHCSRAGFEFTCGVHHLQDCIDQKNLKLSGYLARCDRVWLLFVVEGFAPSSFIELSDEVTSHCFRTGFNRVFVFWSFGRRFFELRSQTVRS
jgi:hypothetical protein